ncbi:MAG: hypothetical protein R2704_08455 [Microthrixaceae bacterium]
MSMDQPGNDRLDEGTDEPAGDETVEGVNRNVIMVAGAAIVAVLLIGAIVLFGGGDDDDDVSLGSTTSASVTTTTADPTATSAEASTTTAAPTSTTASGDATTGDAADTTLAPTPTSGDAPATSQAPSDAPPDELEPIAAGDPRPDPEQPLLGEGRVEDPSGLPTVEDVPDHLIDVSPETINARFDAAESSDHACVKLNAVGSVPDLLSLPDLSADEVARYFSRWQAQAAAVRGSVDDSLAPILNSTRVAMSQIQQIVDTEGDGRFQDPANDLILNPGTELAALAALAATVGQQCPPPPV